MTDRPPRLNLSDALRTRGYTLLDRLGTGATADVFEARHLSTSRRVAIKVTKADLPDPWRVTERLITAWNVGRGLRHPHLVTTLDGGRLDDGRAWVAMERLRGHDLQHELDVHGRFEPSRALRIGLQLCEALLVLHRRGVIHRDVKPENIFLCASGQFADHVKLIDLGVLRVEDDSPHRAHESTGPVIVGTPLYLAPELARGTQPSPQSDLYAVGAVLYHLIAGAPPFDAEDPTAVIERHMHEPVPRLLAGSPLPEPVRALVYRCLAKDPADRPASPLEVVAALEHGLMLLAGDQHGASGEAGEIPAVPPAGVVPEWRLFADTLCGRVDTCWEQGPPPAIRRALAWVAGARRTLDEVEARAHQLRERTDVQARGRIEARTRLEGQLLQIEAALGSGRETLVDATHDVDHAVRQREDLDAVYRQTLTELQALGAVPFGGISSADVLPVAARLREHLALRNELDQDAMRARQVEAQAAEQVAMLLAEQVEVHRVFADVELAEQDEGHRAELLAARAADELLAAQRAFENACLNLYLRYVERGALTSLSM